MIIMKESFSQSSFFKMLSVDMNSAFSDSSSLKSVYEKLRFREGLVWMVV